MALVEKAGEPQPSFEELQRQAEAASGVAEFYDSEGNQGTAVEEEATPIVEVEAPTPEPAPSPEDTPEVEAEAPDEMAVMKQELADAKQKLGQLINENADFRRMQEQAQYQQQHQPLTEQNVSAFDDIIMQDPGNAAYWALQNGQPMLYDRAIRAWHDIDPVAAGRYERQVEQTQLVGALQQQIQPQIAGANAVAQRDQVDAALEAVGSRHEDFAQVIGSLDESRAAEILQSGFPPQILEGLAGDQTSKEKVFETLYRWVKADQAGVLVQAAQDAAGTTAEESRAAKVAATVASAATTTPPPVEESEAERQMRVWQTARPSLREGWAGQDSRARGR